MHTIIKIAVVSVLALFAIVGMVSISKAEMLNLELECRGEVYNFSPELETDVSTLDLDKRSEIIRVSIVDSYLDELH